MIRARAGIGFTLTEAMDDGHCGLLLDELVPIAEQLLEIPAALIEEALDLELEAAEVVADEVDGCRCIFLAGLHRSERAIADRLRTLQESTLPWPYIDPMKAVPWVEATAGMKLAESQRAALRLALLSKVLVITGGPNEFIELELKRLRVAVLGVLDQEHHEKSDNRGAGIDDELPGVRPLGDWAAYTPDRDDGECQDERRCVAGVAGGPAGELIEAVTEAEHGCVARSSRALLY
jgi:hypothetical protein